MDHAARVGGERAAQDADSVELDAGTRVGQETAAVGKASAVDLKGAAAGGPQRAVVGQIHRHTSGRLEDQWVGGLVGEDRAVINDPRITIADVTRALDRLARADGQQVAVSRSPEDVRPTAVERHRASAGERHIPREEQAETGAGEGDARVVGERAHEVGTAVIEDEVAVVSHVRKCGGEAVNRAARVGERAAKNVDPG